jgi:hypothetical protein
MADPVLRSLSSLTPTYKYFEDAQVLTAGHLNDLADYFDDAGRLTRVALVGVGIASGLCVRLQNGRMVITRGVGVTTDGDLVLFPRAAEYDRFKPFDPGAPPYEPFGEGPRRIPLYELVRADAKDDRAVSLAQFSSSERGDLEKAVVVLLVQSGRVDHDLCSSTDCDNLGKDTFHDVKVLLTNEASASQLRPKLDALATPDDAGRALAQVVVPRPIIPSVASIGQLAEPYRKASDALRTDLQGAFRAKRAGATTSAFHDACQLVAPGTFATDPCPGWIATLDAVKLKNPLRGFQYYYDFLEDLAETYRRFRELLLGDLTIVAPDIGAFPKHLVLGTVAGRAGENRTRFYPSCAASGTDERWSHAAFLARKLDVLLAKVDFAVVDTAPPIRITPSAFDDRPLEERAIPFYYAAKDPTPVWDSWSHALHRRGMSAWNQGYHADPAAPGPVANPLQYAISQYPFFRVEGHVGTPVLETFDTIRKLIDKNGLPLVVRAVLVHDDQAKVVVKPPPRFTDWHRWHHLVRQTVVRQLEEVEEFGPTLKENVAQTVARGLVPRDAKGGDLVDIVNKQADGVVAKAGAAKARMGATHQQLEGDPTWHETISDALEAGGNLEADLGDVLKMQFPSPLDAFIGNAQLHWMDWIDEIIDRIRRKELDKALFGAFRTEHPGLEHAAGVGRGGTFVLVYDDKGVVVADFTLPYPVREAGDGVDADDEKPFPGGIKKPGVVIAGGRRIEIPFERLVNDKVRKAVDDGILDRTQFEKEFLDGFRESTSLLGKFANVGGGALPGSPIERTGDLLLDSQLGALALAKQSVSDLGEKVLDPGLDPAAAAQAQQQLKAAEADLAVKTQAVASYVAATQKTVSAGTAGFKAMVQVVDAAQKLTDPTARASLRDGLGKIDASGVSGMAPMLQRVQATTGR